MNSESGILPRQAMLAAIALLVVTIGVLPSSGLLDPGRPVFRGLQPAAATHTHSHVMRSAADPFGGVTVLSGQDPAGEAACVGIDAELRSGLLVDAHRGTASHPPRKSCVVMVITPTEPYPEAEERRRCDRIAMHLAAWESGYEAVDPDRVRHCRYPTANGEAHTHEGAVAGDSEGVVHAPSTASTSAACLSTEGARESCVIEFFRPRARVAGPPSKWSRIALVWVGGHEHEGGLKLHEKLDAICKGIPSDSVDVRLVGPPYSGDLRALIDAVRDSPSSSTADQPAWRERTHWISPTATIPDALLGLTPTDDVPCVRPVPQDDQLLGLIGDELVHRRSPLAEGAVLPVIVFHEIDSEYGRALGDVAQAKLPMPHHGQPRFEVTTVPYLRGLDGSGPGSQTRPAESSARTPSGSSAAPSVSSLTDLPSAMQQLLRASRGEDPAFGSDRSDYVRRLADVLSRRRNADGTSPPPIFAIGLLGTDYYDTLTLLQGLRTRFPQAIFFSLELDARVLNPKHQRWTRNLIVASTGGLESSAIDSSGKPSTGTIPHSFRNDAQRSLFESARRMLSGAGEFEAPADAGAPREGDESSGGAWPGRLYEIGRWTPIRLVSESASIPYESPHWFAALLAASIGIAVILAYGHLTSFPRRDPEEPHHARSAPTPVGGTTGTPTVPGTGAAAAIRQAELHDRRAPTPAKKVLRDIWLLRRRLPRTIVYLTCVLVVLCVNARIVHPERNSFVERLSAALTSVVEPPLSFWLTAIFGSLALSLLLYGLHHWISRLGAVNPRSPLRVLLGTIGVLMLTGLFVLAPYYLLLAAFQGGEPTTWIEGVSVIPTNVIRLLCMFFALGTMVYFWTRLDRDMREIERDCLPRRAEESTGAPASPWRTLMDTLTSDADDDVDRITVRGLWHVLRLRSTWIATSVRVLLVATLWILSISVLFSLWPPTAPVRGRETFWMDLWCMVGVIASATVLNFLIWDRICRCNRFITLLPSALSIYSPEVLRATGQPLPLASSIIDLSIIVRITELPRRLLFVPILLFVIASIARSSVFDNWYMDPALAFALTLSLGLTIYGAMILRMTAQTARRLELERLERLRGGAVKDPANENEYTSKDIDLVKATIAGSRQGPFEDLLHEPTTQAILIAMIPLGLSIVANAISVW